MPGSNLFHKCGRCAVKLYCLIVMAGAFWLWNPHVVDIFVRAWL
jgi:hypothetical protein